MSPWAAGLLLALALFEEGLEPFLLLRDGLVEDAEATQNVLALLAAGGLNACLLNIANFQVTADTSAVTLGVLGNVKSCVSIGVSVLIFGNPLQAAQGLGIVITLSGVYLYQRRGDVVVPEAQAPAAADGIKIESVPDAQGE